MKSQVVRLKKRFEIVVAESAGFCFGVSRAVDMAFAAASACGKSCTPIYSFGPIIHNPQVVARLEEEGVKVISSIDSLEGVGSCSLIFRSHGMPDPNVSEKLKKMGVGVVDATCPYVKKAQVYAKRLVDEGYSLIIVGDTSHPEVASILGHCGGNALVTEEKKDIKRLKSKKKIGIIAQTTQSMAIYSGIVRDLLPCVEDLKILNTICDATSVRQDEARKLARSVDMMIVIGGKNSANTSRIVEVCKAINSRVYHIESETEINTAWFHVGIKKVGITGGASTPGFLIEKTVAYLKAL